MENLTTLEGKYGEEGDRLLFRILNSGDPFEPFRSQQNVIKTSDVAEKGLRYDLTVPFARYVVMHQHETTFPFKRFQVQPVWRADRPQKGRYREFYQCDADIIGSDSLLNEVELVQIIGDVFSQLKIPATVKLNNRKILFGIAEVLGMKDRFVDFTVALDKLDKIGLEKVNEELTAKGLSQSNIKSLTEVIEKTKNATTTSQLAFLKNFLAASETGLKGIDEMSYVFELAGGDRSVTIELDITLARGLNYYTGAIIEVKANDIQMGSICGGGRYDDLTGIFGLPGMSGVGISFGADRIYDVLMEKNLFPAFENASTKILFVNFGEAESRHCLQLVSTLRKKNISAELYPDTVKMAKQLKYANDKKIPFVALIGSEEMNSGSVTVKNMGNGEQHKIPFDELPALLKK